MAHYWGYLAIYIGEMAMLLWPFQRDISIMWSFITYQDSTSLDSVDRMIKGVMGVILGYVAKSTNVSRNDYMTSI